MATVETLKNKDNNTFYPVTKTEAVYNADGSENLSVTLTGIDTELDTKATISTAAADTNKMMKADGTKALVGSSNIDFTTQTITPTINTTNFEQHSSYPLTLYVFGKFAWLVGALSAKTTLSGTSFNAFSIPSGYRPVKYFYTTLCTSNNKFHRGNLAVEGGGAVITSGQDIAEGEVVWWSVFYLIG